MPVTINGSGSIAGLSVGGLGSGVVNTATLADGAATGIKLGAGSVIQRVQNLTYTRAATSSTTYVATAHSVTITPTLASSKILINFSSMVNTNGTNFRAYVDVYRSINGGTFTGIAPQGSNNTTGSSTSAGFVAEVRGDNSRIQVPFNIHYLDSPSYSLGNAIVYKLYVRSSSGSNTIELPASNESEPVINMATEVKG
tara:strand:+ start:20 stop:613 length:594 start_codon:yes stop_codon:yes gene_type:complete